MPYNVALHVGLVKINVNLNYIGCQLISIYLFCLFSSGLRAYCQLEEDHLIEEEMDRYDNYVPHEEDSYRETDDVHTDKDGPVNEETSDDIVAIEEETQSNSKHQQKRKKRKLVKDKVCIH